MKLQILRRGLALTAAAALACGGKNAPEPKPEVPYGNPPPPGDGASAGEIGSTGAPAQPPVASQPPARPPVLLANPPPPSPRERIPVRRGLPAWDDVASPHPPGATNPPSPVLLVTPDGQCYKTWEGGMLPAGPDRVEDRVEPGPPATKIDCPLPRALEVWDAWVEKNGSKPP